MLLLVSYFLFLIVKRYRAFVYIAIQIKFYLTVISWSLNRSVELSSNFHFQVSVVQFQIIIIIIYMYHIKEDSQKTVTPPLTCPYINISFVARRSNSQDCSSSCGDGGLSHGCKCSGGEVILSKASCLRKRLKKSAIRSSYQMVLKHFFFQG